MKIRATILAAVILAIGRATLCGAAGSPADYLNFIKAQAVALRSEDRPPANAEDWLERNVLLRKQLLAAWGGFPEVSAPLNARKLGELQREGYRVERLIFQTFQGVWMTANAYVPQREGKLPTLLMVHGHWRGAKQDPVVQARCIGAAKLGFFVLALDAFGAGERAIGSALGEYHGEMTAATLLPTGLPLSGVQVYENMRAVDYLQTRSEVDPNRIGITGASGGGNQSMYAGAWDERFSAVAPVCSVGNYQSYLGAACCMCEVVPGALRFTEESGVLGMVAPRGLLVINATRDSRQFSVEEARKSLTQALPIFEAMGKPANLRHTVFESGHDYSQPMREAVYGWMALHLKGEGKGMPIPEPTISPEDPEVLRCFPGDSRPADWITLPKFAAAEGRRALKARATSKSGLSAAEFARERIEKLQQLLGGFPKASALNLVISRSEGTNLRELTFTSEPGITLRARHSIGKDSGKLVIVVDLERGSKAMLNAGSEEGDFSGAGIVTLDLRATGDLGWTSDKIGGAPDHTTAQWGFWIGRPLIGQWVWDLRRLLDAMNETDGKLPKDIRLLGIGAGGVVAMAAAALDGRITGVATTGTLTSLITETPYVGQRMGIIVPGMLRDFGDLADLASMVSPRTLVIAGGVNAGGETLGLEGLRKAYQSTQESYTRLSRSTQFQLTVGSGQELARFLRFEE